MIVDTLGMIIALVVHPADIQDRDGAKLLIRQLGTRFRRLEVIFADGGYAGKFVHWAEGLYFRAVEIVKRTDLHRFVVLPKRWIVERTFAWLGKYRRLAKDYETLPECSEAMILIAMTNLTYTAPTPPRPLMLRGSHEHLPHSRDPCCGFGCDRFSCLVCAGRQ